MNIHIIGGGIAGLTTGLALEKEGLAHYRIFERAAALNEVGAGIMLQPNAMQVLDWLGLGYQVRNAGFSINRADITDQKLTPLRQAVQRVSPFESDGLMIAIHRAKLQKILFEHLPREKVRLNYELIDFNSEKDSVESVFKQGLESCEIMLGADGINSRVRQKLFPFSRTRYAGQTCWRGIAKLGVSRDESPIAREAWGPKLRFGFARISTKEMYWYAVGNAVAGGQDQGLLKENLLNKFKIFHPYVEEIIDQTDVDKIIRNDLYDLGRLSHWSAGRICLLGDAAHATTPNLGQGACQGIEDAFFISQALAQNADDPNSAFRKFERSRRKKVDQVVKTSWRLGKMAHHPQMQLVARLLMRLAPERMVAKQMRNLFRVEGLG